MAECLNKRDQYKVHNNSSIDTMKPTLLPPSTFESRPAADPWRELAQATNQVLQLKEENLRLRENKHIAFPAGEEIKARVNIHQTAPPQVFLPPSAAAATPGDGFHLEGIMTRQAGEISDLQKKLAASESQLHQQVAKLESQLAINDAQYGQKVAALQSQLSKQQEDYESKLDQLKEELRMREDSQNRRYKVLESQKQVEDEQGQMTLKLLQAEFDRLRQEAAHTQDQLMLKIKEKEEQLLEQSQKLEQMKTYLGDPQQMTSQQWQRETYQLQSRLETCQREKHSMESTAHLLNIRLNSQNQILVLHEAELSKVPGASQDKKRETLLTRWREKVYELLFQLKCAEIVQKEEERKWKHKVYEVQAEKESYMNQCQVLKHTLADKQAELELQINQVEMLQAELTQAQGLALELDDRRNDDHQVTVALAQMAQRVHDKYCEIEAQSQQALRVMMTYNQRIAFAGGRVELLQSQFARNEALRKLQADEEEEETPTKDTDPQTLLEPDSRAYEQLAVELERVMAERDRLANQIKEDAHMIEKKVAAARQQCAEEVTQLKTLVEDLHGALEEKSQQCARLSQQLEHAHTELEEAKDGTDTVKKDFNRLQLHTEKEVETGRAAEVSKYTELLAAMEHKLNDARREHTKAVVSLRQMERQAARDKERSTEHACMLQQHHSDELAKLQQKLRSSEKDKNLLMATLRQEGLIGKYKAQRAPPADLEDECDDQCVPPQGECTVVSLQHEGQVTEPLQDVIDDLKTLTAAVMEDEDFSSES